MDNITRQEILNKLKEVDPLLESDRIDWPAPYFEDINNIKAIVLGCDPTNQHDQHLKYAFGIGTEIPLLKQFFSRIENNLLEVGLSRKNTYIQNLCQNYFSAETSNNANWQSAAKIWIPFLVEELNALPISKNIPVFLTAADLYKVFLKNGIKKYEPKELYSKPDLLPISAEDNHLNRPLFPLYRGGHGYYDLKKWPDYVEHLNTYFEMNKIKTA